MRIAKHLLLASAAALALAGGTGLALAETHHSMTVQLPDGGLARIEYSGDVPPRVAFVQPSAADYFGPPSPFATLARITARMDREMGALMSDFGMGPPLTGPDGVYDVDLRDLPPGAVHYSAVAATAGSGGFCARSVEITRAGPGGRPHVVRHMSGDCRGIGRAELGVAAPAPRNRAKPPIDVRDRGDHARPGPELLNVTYRPAR